MIQIRTADEMLTRIVDDTQEIDRGLVRIAMQAYAMQFIDRAAEEAKIFVLDEFGSSTVDKESILKIKDLIK